MAPRHLPARAQTGRISLPSRFDIMSSMQYRLPFIKLLRDADKRRLVVDFTGLDYIDSMGIGTLISWERSCKERGKELVLENCAGRIVRMFKIVGVDRLFAFA